MNIRLYEHLDEKAVFLLLNERGIVGSSEREYDILSRCNRLADAVFILESDSKEILATLSLVKRSPTEYWGFHNVSKQYSENCAPAIWRMAIRYARTHNADWFSGMFRPGDLRLSRYYHTLGWVSLSSEEAYNPIPLCYRIWDEIQEHKRTHFKHEINGNKLYIRNRGSCIEVDWGEKIIKCFCDNEQKLLIQEKIKTDMFRSIPETLSHNNNHFNYFSSVGHLQIKESNFILLPPLWANISTTDIHLPIADKWPWSNIISHEDHLDFEQIDKNGHINHMKLYSRKKNNIVIEYSGIGSGSFLRLALQSETKPLFDNNKVIIDDYIIQPLTEDVEYCVFQWSNAWRIFLHIRASHVHLKIEYKT